MTAEQASDRQRQWEFVVRRAFGISDRVPNNDAREELIGCFQDQLQDNGLQNPTRGAAEPIVDALMALGPVEDLDDPTFSTRETAYRLLEMGMTVVDPERLVFDAGFEYPPEVVAAAQQVLDRVGRYLREQPSDD